MKYVLKYILVAVFAFWCFHPLRSGLGTTVPPAEREFTPKAGPEPYALEVMPGLVPDDKLVKAGLLYDVNQNKIVWEKGLFTSFPIASLTKLMTVLLVLEDIREGKLCWDTPIPATPQAALIGSTKIWMKPGQVFTVNDLVKSAMISSANDASYLLGQHCGGTEKSFVERMNERAYKLGMFNTYFSNTTGLPAARYALDNFSSPHDLLLLANEVLKSPEILEIACIDKEQISCEKQKFELKNHNKLTIDYPEVDGLKTGYTRKAGFCIVATAEKEENRVIGIVLGAMSPVQRNDFVAGMFNNYYQDILCVGKLHKPVQEIPKKKQVAYKKKK